MVKVVLLVNGRKRRKVCDIVEIEERHKCVCMLVLLYVFMYLGIYGEWQNVGKMWQFQLLMIIKHLYHSMHYVHTNCICQVLLQELGQTFSSAQPAPCTWSSPWTFFSTTPINFNSLPQLNRYRTQMYWSDIQAGASKNSSQSPLHAIFTLTFILELHE